jgi:hypothetical protein
MRIAPINLDCGSIIGVFSAAVITAYGESIAQSWPDAYRRRAYKKERHLILFRQHMKARIIGYPRAFATQTGRPQHH